MSEKREVTRLDIDDLKLWVRERFDEHSPLGSLARRERINAGHYDLMWATRMGWDACERAAELERVVRGEYPP